MLCRIQIHIIIGEKDFRADISEMQKDTLDSYEHIDDKRLVA